MMKRHKMVKRYETLQRSESIVGYAECQKNHAASIGGYAVDGCREFMASGAQGTSNALLCAACGCHRSFHRKLEQADVFSSSSSSSFSSVPFSSTALVGARRSLAGGFLLVSRLLLPWLLAAFLDSRAHLLSSAVLLLVKPNLLSVFVRLVEFWLSEQQPAD
ncbi:hypothetical protein Cgig2_008521 [Carnegiea gigantea]|uniref:ZF-HD dimerization-type domain-containing protein n=1 Tax=Carnegiea gigantea TaxID=171969 RepID=A0A9Q1JSA0_9CARY|nr:hypothetical protein Cgig2_008521 [Carnegiea gigantea]